MTGSVRENSSSNLISIVNQKWKCEHTVWFANFSKIAMAGQVQKVGLEKHPKGNQGRIQYGTAGFRTKYVLTYF